MDGDWEEEVPELSHYEAQEKDFSHTFDCQLSHGIKAESVTGDGELKNFVVLSD